MAETEVNVLVAVNFSDALLERLRAVSPRLNVRAFPARSPEDVPADVLQDTEVLYTSRMLPEPEHMPDLRWIQFHFAGVDHAVDRALLHSDQVMVTTLSGAAAPQMAEYALMAMLALGRNALAMVEDRQAKRWAEDRYDRFRPKDLRDSTVGIIGYGSVGREVARLAKAFGAKVLATKRDLMAPAESDYRMEGLGDPKGELADRLYPPEATGSMLSECDYAVVTVPLTGQTRGMINEKILGRMPKGAFLIDVSRGGVVDHGALVEALNEGRLMGAALDVFPVEPLPETSPLWDMPNVLISPHVAGASTRYAEQAIDLFAVNLRRYLAEQPLLNLYQADRGY